MFISTKNSSLYSISPASIASSLSCIYIQGRQAECHENAITGFQCQRNENFVSNATGVTSSQSGVGNFDSSLYTCILNTYNQNATIYRCEQCSLDFSDGCAGYDFVLSVAHVVFETAVKNVWFNLPKTYIDDLCATGFNRPDLDLMKCSSTSFNVFNTSIGFSDFLDIPYVNKDYVNLSLSKFVSSLNVDVLECAWREGFNLSVKSFVSGSVYDWSFLFVLIFIAAGGLGNILVCLAVCLDKRLQNVTNYFLFSLAIADLLVSLFVMPMGAIPGFLGYWPLGVSWCNVYVTCDVLACSASIIHMCFISIGRYLGIRNPLKMRHSATKRLMTIKIALVWLLSMIVSSSITVLGLVNHENIMPTPELCSINNRHFRVLGSLIVFYIPMLTMVVSYALTVQLLRRQAKLADTPVVPGSAHRRLCGRQESNELRHFGFKSSSANDKNHRITHSATWRVTCSSRSVRSIPLSISHPGLGCLAARRDQATQTPACIATETASGKFKSFRLPTSSFNLRFLATRKKGRSLSANAVANEQKASKVLGLVFFTFVLCWAPFFVFNVLSAILPGFHVPDHVVDICLWLGYVSSTINPIIYTIFNKTFRGAFLRILRCRCYRWARSSRYRAVHGASQLCARSALPLAISLRPAPLPSQDQGAASETALM